MENYFAIKMIYLENRTEVMLGDMLETLQIQKHHLFGAEVKLFGKSKMQFFLAYFQSTKHGHKGILQLCCLLGRLNTFRSQHDKSNHHHNHWALLHTPLVTFGKTKSYIPPHSSSQSVAKFSIVSFSFSYAKLSIVSYIKESSIIHVHHYQKHYSQR
jgi:hypothetical protein